MIIKLSRYSDYIMLEFSNNQRFICKGDFEIYINGHVIVILEDIENNMLKIHVRYVDIKNNNTYHVRCENTKIYYKNKLGFSSLNIINQQKNFNIDYNGLVFTHNDPFMNWFKPLSLPSNL